MSASETPQPKQQSTDDQTMSRLASIGQISAGIAHEVKNPLTVVKGFLQLLQEESENTYINLAQSELERALATLENLLNVSKPVMDEEVFVDINICAELESLLFLFQDQSYQVEVEKFFRDPSAVITGQRNQIKRAFFNLIKNAFEALNGSGKLVIEQEVSNGRCRIIVRDTGSGIPEEKLALLGTPFFTTKSDGTGMGLTQVFSAIYQSGGTIDVTSKVGKGTAFLIDLPIKRHTVRGAKLMDLSYQKEESFDEFYSGNMEALNETLRRNARNLFGDIYGRGRISEAYILEGAHSVIRLLNEDNEHGLVLEAKRRGKIWAEHDLTLIVKLEWFQFLRTAYLELLQHYWTHSSDFKMKRMFDSIQTVNHNMDSFLKHFSASFTELKNEQIRAQMELIDDLSVPVIPLSPSVAILPIIGMIDTSRAKRIQQTVLEKIAEFGLLRLVIDLSGVAFMDTAIAGHMFRIIEGIRLLGCKTVLTGLRPTIVNTIIEQGIVLTDKVEIVGTLQQAIESNSLDVE
ncbi:ATP-binding protein [Alicyclobacillus sp. SO9]|uniref:ATP-binding protein n=1 Tax=Alicyclobacillus sp. SO9 TaxID=2665646 RepID=UPI0018E80097|nr:ATP-binding protein [Alicyclobacillus sp. SO9]QQE79961.1 STAS domain-containing protein [Alicyclobacillus sp. SO9]